MGKKNNRKSKKSPGSSTGSNSNNKRLSSGSSSKSVESDGETGSVQDEQMVPILTRREISNHHQNSSSRPARNEFAFSDLIRECCLILAPFNNHNAGSNCNIWTYHAIGSNFGGWVDNNVTN